MNPRVAFNVSAWKSAQPSQRIVVNEFRLGLGRRAWIPPEPGRGRFTVVELSAWTVLDPTYSTCTDVLLVTGVCRVRFHTSLYSTEKLWLTPLAPIAPLGFWANILLVVHRAPAQRATELL